MHINSIGAYINIFLVHSNVAIQQKYITELYIYIITTIIV
jgi:hypothetical protein